MQGYQYQNPYQNQGYQGYSNQMQGYSNQSYSNQGYQMQGQMPNQMQGQMTPPEKSNTVRNVVIGVVLLLIIGVVVYFMMPSEEVTDIKDVIVTTVPLKTNSTGGINSALVPTSTSTKPATTSTSTSTSTSTPNPVETVAKSDLSKAFGGGGTVTSTSTPNPVETVAKSDLSKAFGGGGTVTSSSALVGKFNADNYLSINVNDVVIYPENTAISWTTQHNVTLPNIKAGDIVQFRVRNAGGPGGFIGSWTWNGKTYYVKNTLFPDKKIISNGSSIWGAGVGNQYPDAQWLWGTDNCEYCTHAFSWIAA